MKGKLSRFLGPALAVLLFSIALFILHHELKKYHYADIVSNLNAIPAERLSLAFVLTIANYFVLTLFDALGIVYVRKRIPYPKVALTSFIGYTFSHNIGLSILSGGSVRYYLYTAWGLSAIEVANVIAFTGATFIIGLIHLGGWVVLLEPHIIPAELYPAYVSFRPLGILLLGVVAVYMALGFMRKEPFRFRGWEFRFPSPKLAFLQIVVSSLDWAFVAGIIYALLPPSGFSYAEILGIFLIGNFAGLMSHIPGGLGVFETVLIYFLSPSIPSTAVISALIVYRGMYYIFPFIVSLALFGGYEAIQRKEALRKLTASLGSFYELIPHFLTFTAFLSGAVLLFSSSIPPEYGRLSLLAGFEPLAFIELSHLLASLTGVGLLLIARSLQRRLSAAYYLTIALLGAGVVFSILKGLDYIEALIIFTSLMLFLPSKNLFYRKASILREPFTPGWITAIIFVLLITIWLTLLSLRQIGYSHDLWWAYSFEADASRILRSLFAVMAGLTVFIFYKLLGPEAPKPILPGKLDLEQAHSIAQKSGNPYSLLVLLGDKDLLLNESKNAFIMYGISGRSWVSLGGPVGPSGEHPELIWKFYELSDIYSGLSVFYNAPEQDMSVYSDLGLAHIKTGEEGKIDLDRFSLEDKKYERLKRTEERLGDICEFNVVLPEDVDAFLPELRLVSEAWLARKSGREKKFSEGFFNEDYLKQFPVAIIKTYGKITAFANILEGAGKGELTADMIRYTPSSPDGIFEYILTKLILFGKEDGFRYFNIGSAPLSVDAYGTELWDGLNASFFKFGEHFKDMKEIRLFKERFHPEWSPRFLVYPPSFELPHILSDITELMSGE